MVVGPIPPFSNPPIEPQYYEPSRFVISGITNGSTSIVTTSENHNYVVGQSIRILISMLFGAYQFNNLQANVISIPSPNQVIIDINSLNFNTFKSSSVGNSPQIIAIGDVNSGQISTSNINQETFIPGSFINIS